MSQDLNQIVVRSSRDVTFHYHVNGIRHAFKDWQVVAEGLDFRPTSADQKMPGAANDCDSDLTPRTART